MSNGYEDEQIEVDYCNEFLMINLLERSIIQNWKEALYKTNINHKTVTRIQLNRTKENDLNSQFFHSSETLVEKWSSDLPGLKKLNLDRLDKTKMFQHLVNLEELEIWCMDLAKVDSNIFACNKNLRKLKIRGTVLTLNNQSFNGLVNLTELKLSSDIVALPDGLFDSCTALKVVNLSHNKLIELETSSFQSLVSLEELDLSYNSIKELDSNMFLCNKKLIKLRLYTNKITKLNEDFLKGLSQLTHLDLAYNEMFSLPECPFDNCLKVVNLSHNKFIELETLSFQSLVNLEELDLSYNSIERADYSNIFACNKNLRKLNLSHISSTSFNNQSFNGLEDLFNGLVNLTLLNLSDNRIMSLPDGIFQNLINLKELNLSSNLISELTSSLFNSLVSLEDLDLNRNKLTTIPKGLFDNLISLKFLNLKENEIELQKDSDPNIFIGLRKLTGLELEGNQISFLPEGIFKNLVSLEELGLEQNHIMSLPKDFFKDLISLKSLRLRSNFIDTEGEDPLWIDKKNIKPFPKHIQLDLNEYDDSDDPDSTDEMINEQNDPEADAEKDTKKRDRDCKENVGETLDVHDDESNPKRFKN
jgi:Leucine-rich repeat (LRR) protein